ncbi:flavin reductase [Actinoplanes flavus]|uniref:Flavin reductase n=1 Tax=Actinoplanes flavus TaxID=2820290 RepID=A0ABS3UTL5_9ACTN|nr:flavin reductase [Actinoplanes flavus]MBO3741933.1 flavin reductase [Actinoplanes flavus]
MTLGQAAGLAHQPDGRTYDCRGCRKPWPCGRARAYLLATNDRVSLSLRMAMELEAASMILTGQDRYLRFFLWAREASPTG